MQKTYGVKEGWEFASKNMGSAYSAIRGSQYVSEVEAAIQQLSKDMNDKLGTKESVDTLKGFIAEYWHADSFNINAVLRGSSNRAVIERSTEAASVDVSTNFGNDYSMKYYATGVDSAKQQATNVVQAYHKYLAKSKAENPMSFEEYISKNGYSGEMQELLKSVYQGQGRVIPTEQLKDAMKYLERKIATEQAREGINRMALLEGYKETLQMLTDRIQDGEGIESIPLTKKEAEVIAALCKTGDFKPEDFGFGLNELITTEFLLQQALQAGFTSAMLSLVMQLGPEIYKALDYLIHYGELDAEQLKSMGLKALSASAAGFLRGAVSASLTISCQAGKLGNGLMNVSPGVVGAVTVLVFDVMKDSFDVVRGKKTVRELSTSLTKEILISSASLAGGTVGQAILPELPVLGYMLGSFIGSVVASFTITASEKTILSFCVDTGFSFFGLVEQDYVLSKEAMQALGLKLTALEYADIKRTALHRTEIKHTELKRAKLHTIDVFVLRRGVIGVNKIGYMN